MKIIETHYTKEAALELIQKAIKAGENLSNEAEIAYKEFVNLEDNPQVTKAFDGVYETFNDIGDYPILFDEGLYGGLFWPVEEEQLGAPHPELLVEVDETEHSYEKTSTEPSLTFFGYLFNKNVTKTKTEIVTKTVTTTESRDHYIARIHDVFDLHEATPFLNWLKFIKATDLVCEELHPGNTVLADLKMLDKLYDQVYNSGDGTIVFDENTSRKLSQMISDSSK